MLLAEIDPRTFKDNSAGSSLTLYRRAGQREPVEGGTFVAVPKAPVKVSGDTVYVVFAAAYPQPGQTNWGCKVTAKAVEEEERMDLPWLLDLCKSVGLLSGKCTGVLLRGERSDKSEKVASVNQWLQSELLSQGIEFDEQMDTRESKDLTSLNLQLLSSMTGAGAGSAASAMPFLARTRSYAGVSIPDLVTKLAAKMKAARVNPGFFPTPPEVQAIVDKAIHSYVRPPPLPLNLVRVLASDSGCFAAYRIVAVVLKHNKLIGEAQKWLEDSPNAPVPPNLARAWKTPHKLRQYVLQKYQVLKNLKENENADRATLYTKLCSEIVKRAEFLLQIVPVPSPEESAAYNAAASVGGAPGAPTLRRMRSSEVVATPAPAEEVSKAAAADSKEGDSKEVC